MKQISKNSLYQLLVIYSILILAISLGFLSKYTLQFSLFALIISLISIFAISNNKEELKLNKKLHITLFIIAISLIIILRFIPYIDNNIPLGYDSGIYKYAIESGLKNQDQWLYTGVTTEPGFLYLMELFKPIFSIEFILTYLLILFTILLGVSIYLTTKVYFNKTTALISIFIYAFSLIQFKTFWFMYYKNIIGLTTMLFSIYFHKKNKRIPFILLAGITGAIHRPTFYIFGLTYFIYTFINPINKKYNFRKLRTNIFNGVIILLIFFSFYIGKYWQSIEILINPVIQGYLQPGESSGTFINFFTYQFSILPYLPFALIGLFYLIKNKQFNLFVIWAIINLSIVYFQFFFFNRFIIMLDIILIILASLGFYLIIKNNNKIGLIITILLLFSAGILAYNDSINSKPLISEEELQVIEYLKNTPENSFVMATSSIYSPWLQGYSNRPVIAPGLFDNNLHTEEEWNIFWRSNNLTEIKEFLNKYNKPLYIFIGKQQQNNLIKFKECFSEFYKINNNLIYEYTC